MSHMKIILCNIDNMDSDTASDPHSMSMSWSSQGECAIEVFLVKNIAISFIGMPKGKCIQTTFIFF